MPNSPSADTASRPCRKAATARARVGLVAALERLSDKDGSGAARDVILERLPATVRRRVGQRRLGCAVTARESGSPTALQRRIGRLGARSQQGEAPIRPFGCFGASAPLGLRRPGLTNRCAPEATVSNDVGRI